MSTPCLTARGPATVEARPDNNAIVIKVGEAVLSLDVADALQVSHEIAATAGNPDLLRQALKAFPDRGLGRVVVAAGGHWLLAIPPAEWGELARQGSSAALELHRETIRTGLRTGPIQRGNSDLVEVTA